MNFKNLMLGGVAVLGLLATSCSEDDNDKSTEEATATIAGGPYLFQVDGKPDFIPEGDIKLTVSNVDKTSKKWIITDADGKILGLPEKASMVNFDEAGTGKCLVWYIAYNEGIEGLEKDKNANDLKGDFVLSNSLTVNRAKVSITGGPFNFVVDLAADNLADDDIKVSTEGTAGTEKKWIVTDADGKILGLPPMPSAVDFNGAGVGKCLVWYIGYESGLKGLEMGKNANDLEGYFVLSNAVEINRNAPEGAAALSGGPFEFKAGDGTPDNIAEGAITMDKTNAIGANSSWIVTDEAGEKILGVPPSFTGPNFDGAGTGVCYLWYATYGDGVTGIEMDKKVSEISGKIYLSNPIKVIRN